MNILILGAGQVGASVAEALASEANDITIVDHDGEGLAQLAERIDLRTVVGNAINPSVLREARIDDADLLIAVTQSDQTNLVACKIARSLFHVPTRIARIRTADFLDPFLLANENFAVDHAICPEQEITDYIARLIEFPEALQVVDFAAGRVVLVGLRIDRGDLLAGQPIRALREHLPAGIDARIAAVFRDHRPLEPEGKTAIKAGDEIFLLAASGQIRRVLQALHKAPAAARRVLIAGGGNIGARVAQRLEANYEVKLVERERGRAETIAMQLAQTLVLTGDATDENLLTQENIDETDVFLALTNDDEDNIMAASLAKQLGCRRVLALINRRAYADMVQGGPIDIALSPAQVSIGTLLTHVRRGDVARVHRLRRGAAEALELIAHGDAATSKVIGRRIEQLPKIGGARIAAIVRRDPEPALVAHGVGLREVYREHVIIAHHDTVVEAGDRVIVFCTHRRQVKEVERLFQVAAGFL
ncbi:MAG TPA: Trk system potassium transporter TrkA [Azospira sp.]|nr:Trk system potassium transporter TrkA [Azospira sp.]